VYHSNRRAKENSTFTISATVNDSNL